jgi:hypothetical protein
MQGLFGASLSDIAFYPGLLMGRELLEGPGMRRLKLREHCQSRP